MTNVFKIKYYLDTDLYIEILKTCKAIQCVIKKEKS